MKKLFYFVPAVAVLAVALLFVPVASAQSSHSATLTWTLSTDDTTANCTTTANCLQNVYRAVGSCTSSTISWTLLTTTALSATVSTYIDSTVTPGQWCYGVTFGMNGLESAKLTAAGSLQPASQTALSVVLK